MQLCLCLCATVDACALRVCTQLCFCVLGVSRKLSGQNVTLGHFAICTDIGGHLAVKWVKYTIPIQHRTRGSPVSQSSQLSRTGASMSLKSSSTCLRVSASAWGCGRGRAEWLSGQDKEHVAPSSTWAAGVLQMCHQRHRASEAEKGQQTLA